MLHWQDQAPFKSKPSKPCGKCLGTLRVTNKLDAQQKPDPPHIRHKRMRFGKVMQVIQDALPESCGAFDNAFLLNDLKRC